MKQPRIKLARTVAGLAIVVLSAAGLAACGSDSGGSDGGKGKAEGPSASLLPDNLKESGTWTVAVMPDYPPQSYVDLSTNKLVGVNIDVVEALGKEMGLKTNLAQVKYDAMLAGLDADRYEMAGVGFYATPEREASAKLVGYLKARQSILVSKSYSGPELSSYLDLCDTTVALVAGTPHEKVLKDLGPECENQGKKPADVQVFPGDTQMFAAVTSGRADATITSTATSDHMVEESGGEMERAGESFTCTIAGFAVRKDDDQLFAALSDAMTRLQESGDYKKILDKWNLGELALDKPTFTPIAGTFSTEDCSAT